MLPPGVGRERQLDHHSRSGGVWLGGPPSASTGRFPPLAAATAAKPGASWGNRSTGRNSGAWAHLAGAWAHLAGPRRGRESARAPDSNRL